MAIITGILINRFPKKPNSTILLDKDIRAQQKLRRHPQNAPERQMMRIYKRF